MKYASLFTVSICFSMNTFAQKQNFDAVSYTAPKDWQKTQNESAVQLSVSDKKTGAYAIIVITKATESEATANENFTTDWTRLVKSTVQVTAEPAMQEPSTKNGWDIVSGNASYTDRNKNGLATLITATGGAQTFSVILLTNTQQYQNELQSFVQSLELTNVASSTKSNNSSGSADTNAKQLLGIWGQYQNESNTSGYDWREYYFSADGTYQFLEKSISYLYHNDIVYIYEKGNYKLNGNQLTITPQSGTIESWSKAGGDKAGKLLKTEKRTLENTTYSFIFHYFSGIQKTNLVLQNNKQTLRDGAFSTNAGFKNSWLYGRPFDPGKPSIELPAGTNIKFRFMPGATSGSAEIKKDATGTAVNSPLTGKIWEGTSTEKFSNAAGTSYNTGGFSTIQYRFFADGTYRFVSVVASHYTDTKLLGYETGAYTISGNQLSIIPAKAYNEEWSKTGKTTNGNSDVTNRAINETWGKKLKTSARKPERVTYTFSIGNNAGRTALILQYSNGQTEREGKGSQVYLNETAEAKSVKLPAGIN